MAANCKYEEQLRESSRLVTEAVGRSDFTVAYQSRSGPPTQPWLEPDIGDVVKRFAAEGVKDLVVVPIMRIRKAANVDLVTYSLATRWRLRRAWRPCWISVVTSAEKVENVVSPPRKPVTTSRRHSGGRPG